MTHTFTPEISRGLAPAKSLPVVAVIGGGFTGAALARHLADDRLRIVIYEPRATLGAGLAYDTNEPVHRINVPAAKMGLHGDEADSFLHFAASRQGNDADLTDAKGQPFPQRGLFGAYVAHALAPHLQAGRVRHAQTRVTAVRRNGAGWQVSDEAGGVLQADAVVIATSHPPPALPAVLRPLAGDPRLLQASAWTNRAGDQAFERIATDARILVVGNGLTGADAIATLDRLGHRGPVLAVSRHGLRSKGHNPLPQEPFGTFLPLKSPRASDLLRHVRAEVARAKAEGIGWQAVFDQLRADAQDIWAALPLAEHQRIIRHLRAIWDVHRFRIAPQVEQVLDRAIAAGRLQIRAASPVVAKAGAEGLQITLRDRHSGALSDATFDAVITATGPAHGSVLSSQPLLAGLRDAGDLTPCPTGLGIACDRHSRAIRRDGRAEPTLLIAGPLARGTFGELMGLPQVADHAFLVASELQALLLGAAAGTTAAPHPITGADTRHL